MNAEAGRWGGRTLHEWLPEVIADVVRAFDPLKIVLFGSLARGDWGGDSDIDLLVVLPSAPSEQKARLMSQVRASIRAPAPIDVFVTDPVETERRGGLRSSLLHVALQEGAVVHERAA